MFKRIKCFIFYKVISLLGRLIKDEAYREEFYELASEIWAQDGLF